MAWNPARPHAIKARDIDFDPNDPAPQADVFEVDVSFDGGQTWSAETPEEGAPTFTVSKK